MQKLNKPGNNLTEAIEIFKNKITMLTTYVAKLVNAISKTIAQHIKTQDFL